MTTYRGNGHILATYSGFSHIQPLQPAAGTDLTDRHVQPGGQIVPVVCNSLLANKFCFECNVGMCSECADRVHGRWTALNWSFIQHSVSCRGEEAESVLVRCNQLKLVVAPGLVARPPASASPAAASGLSGTVSSSSCGDGPLVSSSAAAGSSQSTMAPPILIPPTAPSVQSHWQQSATASTIGSPEHIRYCTTACSNSSRKIASAPSTASTNDMYDSVTATAGGINFASDTADGRAPLEGSTISNGITNSEGASE